MRTLDHVNPTRLSKQHQMSPYRVPLTTVVEAKLVMNIEWDYGYYQP